MSIISHMSVDYDAPVVEVQSDSSATNLIDDEIPTGQTIKSYLNSNLQNSEFVGYVLGTNTTRANTGRLLANRALKMIEFNLNNIMTGAALTVGNTYFLGAVTNYPYANIYANVNRQDGGNAVATLRLNTDGRLDLMPLMSIPTGVVLYAHFTYFYR